MNFGSPKSFWTGTNHFWRSKLNFSWLISKIWTHPKIFFQFHASIHKIFLKTHCSFRSFSKFSVTLASFDVAKVTENCGSIFSMSSSPVRSLWAIDNFVSSTIDSSVGFRYWVQIWGFLGKVATSSDRLGKPCPKCRVFLRVNLEITML